MFRFLILYLVLSTNNLYAQLITNGKEKIAPSQKMILEVKVISQFYERFNFKNTPGNHLVDSVFRTGVTRKSNISLLFNPAEYEFDSTSVQFSQNCIDTVGWFIDRVCDSDNPLYINKFSNFLFAELICNVLIKSKPCKVKLWLRLVEAERKSYKWTILNAEGSCIEIRGNSDSKIAISPMSDETNFISLGTELNGKDNLANYVPTEFHFSTLNNFLFGLQHGIIKFQLVEDLTYHILDIEGWDIKVKEIKNQPLLNGWLITHLYKFNMDRNQYIHQLTLGN